MDTHTNAHTPGSYEAHHGSLVREACTRVHEKFERHSGPEEQVHEAVQPVLRFEVVGVEAAHRSPRCIGPSFATGAIREKRRKKMPEIGVSSTRMERRTTKIKYKNSVG